MRGRTWVLVAAAAVLVWALGLACVVAAEAPPAAAAPSPANAQGNADAAAKPDVGQAASEASEPPPIVASDPVLMKEWAKDIAQLRRDAEAGTAPAQFVLGIRFLQGNGVPKDAAEAVKWYRKAAEQGLPEAQGILGACYAQGLGVPKDAAQATEWFQKAAEQGLPVAQLELAHCYAQGTGVRQDDAEAVKWIRKAAEQGFAEAQHILGASYAAGKGAPKDEAEAVKWYRKAAEQGLAPAQFSLGVCYATGRGVAKDVPEAAKWYRRAAEQSFALAQLSLARCYGLGEGIPKDDAEAAWWCRKAAEQGLVDAQFMLGLAYELGSGVVLSQSAALEWYSKAARSYLKEGNRDGALTCYDRMKALEAEHFLTRQLSAELYPRETGEGGAPAKKDVASGTAWPAGGGYVVTNHHVVAGRGRVRLVGADGTEIPSEVVSADAANDLVLLKADPKLLPPALPLASAQPQVGQGVFTIGYPHPDIMGREAKVTDGIINATTGVANDPRLLQVSAAIQAGNSGGPLLNMQGEVVGVVCGKLDALLVWAGSGDLPENVGYAIKVGYVRTLLESAGAKAPPGGTAQPPTEASLEQLAARVRPSVLLVVAE